MRKQFLFFTYENITITYELHMMHRKTIEISVHPDAFVIVKAPLKCAIHTIEERVYKKAAWIIKHMNTAMQKKLQYKEKSYADGEEHVYLGKKYYLNTISSEKNTIYIKNEYLFIEKNDTNTQKIKEYLDIWYIEQAKHIFPQLYAISLNKFSQYNIVQPKLKIRTMKTRWGSYSTKGTITLNTQLIFYPKICIEYVIIHELCHIFHLHHDAAFYNLLQAVLPDWKERKRMLKEFL